MEVVKQNGVGGRQEEEEQAAVMKLRVMGSAVVAGSGIDSSHSHTRCRLLLQREEVERWQSNSSSSYVNSSISRREMDSLTAICDAFLPSLHASAADADADADADAVARFYHSSASMAATPQHIGRLMCERVEHPKKWLIRLALWVLSTWVGTFILCGPTSLSTHFPFCHPFSRLPLHKREQILLSWSLSFFYPLRMLFKSIKLLTLLVFFSQVDEKKENLSWKAIGYCGADPEFEQHAKSNAAACGNLICKEEEHCDCKQDGDIDEMIQERFGPLCGGLINLQLPRNIVADNLRRFGFPVSLIPPKKKLAPASLIIKCDAVVVGSGSGGGVVAGVLAKAGYKVLVLEKGNYYARSNLSLLEGPSMAEMYMSGGMLATDDMGVVILAGSTVGGGSTINWSASLKTPQHVTTEWCDRYGLELFESKLYKEAMDVVCERMGVQSGMVEEGFNNAVLRKGCEELGYPVNDIPRNSPPDHYCGWCCMGCKDGSKKGTSETWLVDLVNSGNGVILPGCEAIKVLHTTAKAGGRGRATGVAFRFQHDAFGGAKDMICLVESKVTIVACGALNTPPLLKRSGLKNANIGKNLHLHPVTMAWGYFPDHAPNSSTAGCWPEKEKKSYEGGIMTAMSTVVADTDKSGYGAVLQTPALHPGMFSTLMPWLSGADIKRRMLRFSRTAHVFALARDKASGSVHSPNSISYRMEAADEENLKKGLEKTLRILAAAGAEEIGTHHCKGKSINVKGASSDEFERFVEEESGRPLRDLNTQICSAHQMGSCRMGIDPTQSVVNQMGETWEVEGLFVADSSVFPTALGVNPMVTIQAIAYCTAQSVLDVLKRKKTTY